MSEQDADATVVLEPPPQVRPRSREREKVRTKTQPPYAVIVENDDLHTFEYVIEVLQKVLGYDLQKAFVLTTQVHLSGQAIVLSGTLVGRTQARPNPRLRPGHVRDEAGHVSARRTGRAIAGLKRFVGCDQLA